MLNVIKRSLGLALLLVLVACSREGSSTGNNSNNNSGGTGGNATINGMSDVDFYNQFVFKQDERGLYKICSPSDSLSLAELSTDHTQKARLTVKLMSNHSFIARYEELYNYSISGSTISSNTGFQKDFTGQWSIENGYLVLPQIGRGTGLLYNLQPAIVFHFENSINNPALKGKNIVIQAGWSTSPNL